MKNWSRHLEWQPHQVFSPETEEEIKVIVQQAAKKNQKIRVIGSGHSFTQLCPTDGFQISLDKFQGLLSVDTNRLTAKVKAGTKLHLLNELLFQKGLAMPNMGDINQQSIAGSISTGTHGTGIHLGNISTQVIALKFVNGKGEIIDCSKTNNKELFKAAQISLGALGIITEVELQCVPAFNLELKMDKMSLQEVLQTYDSINENTRNFEFYWFPNTETVMTKKLNITEETPHKSGFSDYFQEMILENYAFRLLCDTANTFPRLTHWASRFSANTISAHTKVSHSHKVFVTERLVRFNEMEYNVPYEAYADVKKDIIRWVAKHNKNILFPLENRFAAADDIWLSPAYKRKSAYIAVHAYHKKDFRPYFSAMEEIFRAYDGRPHWGKMNFLYAEDFAQCYPQFASFNTIRKQHDPQDLFLTNYLKKILIGE